MRARQQNQHVIVWLRIMGTPVAARRYWNVWYRGKVPRMHQLKQISRRGDRPAYNWLKDLWRRELTRC